MVGKTMIVKISDNIISPLGTTTEENYVQIKAKASALRCYTNKWGLPEPFFASLFKDNTIEQLFRNEALGQTTAYTLFEQLAILSVQRALQSCSYVDVSSPRVQFVLSTTKGNIDLLDNSKGFSQERVYLGCAAQYISKYFNNRNTPIVVSNACTSGACAQLTAWRLLHTGQYDYVIVIGAELQSKFIVSGFQSFKALSTDLCRPFDEKRCGLNIGEAAATIIYAKTEEKNITHRDWTLVCGAIRNDANHISGPSRTGEGCYRALSHVLQNRKLEDIALLNTHGTATIYNDEMEAIAIERSGLAHIPINSLKGYYGHTMGAAGVLETIINQRALDDNLILGTRGFKNLGVSRAVVVSSEHSYTSKNTFVKMLSGFGGCNAVLLFKKGVE